MAASFANAAYERLPLDDEETLPTPGNASLESPGINQQQQLMPNSSANLFQELPQNLLNSCQLPTEGYWGTGRPPY
jgi:hypothetical protein